MAPSPIKFIGFGAIDATKPYKFIGLGGSDGPASDLENLVEGPGR